MNASRSAAVLTLLALGALVAPAPAQTPAQTPSACVACHAELEDELHVAGQAWERDVHREVGLGCEACHGGNPSPELSDDAEASMDPAAGFRGAPDRFTMAEFCGTCHADLSYMRRYDPQARVDQLAEYRTSVHGTRNAGGDPVPATCTDCHGVHGILSASRTDSPVHPTRVPATCASCHADAAKMQPYGVPVDQHEKYLRSAHAAALFDRGDLSAPTCNDCHGNHGAAPPGVESVANVCGQCHARQAGLFRASFKKGVFDELELGECTVCHGNHEVRHPSPEMFHGGSAPTLDRGWILEDAPLEADVGDLEAGQTAEAAWTAILEPYLKAADPRWDHRVVLAAEGLAGIEIDATVRPGARPSLEPPRSVEAAGLSAMLTVEALSGEPVRAGDALRFRLQLQAAEGANPVGVRIEDRPGAGLRALAGSVCLNCHSLGDECDQATDRMYAAVSGASREIREAEALLHRVEVAGMDVKAEEFELKSRGTTALVDAGALIHSFDPDRLEQRAAEAGSVVAKVREAALAALAELQFRRRGLAVSLVLIALVLVALFLKIREVDRKQARRVVDEADNEG